MHRRDFAAHIALRDTARAASPAPRPAAPAAPAVNPKPATLADALRWIAAASALVVLVGAVV